MVAITIDGSPELGRYSVIDSSSYLRYADDRGTKDLRGYEGRDYSKHPFGSLPFGAIPFKTIPRSEWRDRIAEGHAKKTFPIYHQLRKKVPIKNQRQTPYCHSDDTEVLTADGWVQWPNYDGQSDLATINPYSHSLEFQTPSCIHVCEYDGQMIHSTNAKSPFSVTPDHRMLVRRWDERARTLRDDYEFVLAKDLGWYSGLLSVPKGYVAPTFKQIEIDGRVFDGDDFIALIALVVSDGFAGSSEKGVNTVSYCCFDKRMQPRVRELSHRLGFKEQPEREGVWSLHCLPELAKWVRENCYHGTPYRSLTKCVPTLVKISSARQIKHFLEWFGDRTNKGYDSGRSTTYSSSSRRLIDDIQELLFKVGIRSGISRQDGRTSHYNGQDIVSKERWNCIEYSTEELSISRKKQIETETYKGSVFCATVPNGTLVTRKDGRILISGNCWINSVTGAIQSIRAVAGWDTIALSSASAGAPGKNYRSEGGWTGEAIGYIQKYGLVPEDQWPNDAIDKSYFRGTREVAELYGIGQWFELRAKNFDEVMTCLLMNYPVPVGLLWWGHSIFYSAPVYESGAYGVIGDNSWGPEWENEGRTVLMEDKATPDEANCVTSPKLVADPITTKKFTSFFSSLKAA